MGIRTNGTTSYVEIADEAAFDWERTQAFSAAMWIYLPASSVGPAVAKAQFTTTGKGWAVNTEPNAGPALDVHLTNDNVGGNHLHAFGPDGFTLGGLFTCRWQHIGFSYDGSSDVSGVLLYVDGLNVASGAGSNANVNALSASILTDEEVRIGFIDAGEFWAGAAADLVLVDAVMAASEFALLADLANIGRNREELLGRSLTLALPAFSLNDLMDMSGNGHNGTAVSSPVDFPGPTITMDRTAGPAVSTSPANWTHTPRQTNRGVVVTIAQSGNSSDDVTGVTYGGVAMTRVTSVADAAGEVGRTYIYFLGVGVPSGAQTVSVSVSSGVGSKKCQSIGLHAKSDIRVAASGTQSGDQANPSITLATGASYEGQVIACLFSGEDALTAITAGTEYLRFGTNDFGTTTCADEAGQKSGANVVCNFTIVSNDVAMVAAAFEAMPPPHLRLPILGVG